MKKLLVVVVLLAVSGIALAQGWGYATPNRSTTRYYDSLVLITTTPDTSVAFYFDNLNSAYATVYMRHRAKNATLSTLQIPRIDYKLIDGTGKFFGTDSTVAGAWIALSDSSHLTITAGDTVYQFKSLGNYPGAAGVRFRGRCTCESTKTIIRVTGSK